MNTSIPTASDFYSTHRCRAWAPHKSQLTSAIPADKSRSTNPPQLQADPYGHPVILQSATRSEP